MVSHRSFVLSHPALFVLMDDAIQTWEVKFRKDWTSIVPNTSILKLLLISPLVVQSLLQKANVKKEIKKVKQIKKRRSKSNLKEIRS